MTTLLNISLLLGISIEVYLIIVLFGLIIYFILHRTLRTRIQDNKKRNTIAIISTMILAPCVYLIVAFVFFSIVIFPPEFQKDFDQAAWNDLKGIRFEMRNDLVESKLLLNKGKLDVKELLGEPDKSDSAEIWTYDLGVSKAGFGWQYNDLKVHFKNGRVEKPN